MRPDERLHTPNMLGLGAQHVLAMFGATALVPVLTGSAAVALIVGAGNYTLDWGDYQFAGIALGSLAAIVIYQVLRAFSPEVETRTPEEGGAFGDPFAGPIARTPDPRAT